jgi:hypothetical protein
MSVCPYLPSKHSMSQGSVVGIATGVGVRVPVGSRISILQLVQIGSWVHPTSYQMRTGGLFPRV